MANLNMDEQKLMEMQLLSQQLQELQKYLQQVERQLLELKQVISSVEEFKSVKVDDEMLGPIANGIFVKSRLAEKDNFIVNVGGNVMVEKTVKETIGLLSNQQNELENYRNETINEFNQLAVKLESIQKELK